MVLTRRYWWGKTGAQPLLGSRGRKLGLMLPPPLIWVRSVSTDSSNSTMVPMAQGHAPAGAPRMGLVSAGGESLRLKVTSYQKPVVIDRKSTRLNSSHVRISYA